MQKYSLKAAKRTITGRKVKTLRKEGQLPANIYGKHVASISIQVPIKEFASIFQKAGETGLIDLTLGGKIHPVLIHNVQIHPVTSLALHADFLEVNIHEKITAKVPVVFIGESPAVKNKVGVLLTLLNDLEITALPTDLPDKIEVDVTSLSKVDDSIKVSSLKVPGKVTVLTPADSDLVKVAPLISREAEQMATAEAAAAAAQAAGAPDAGQVPAESAAPGTPEKKEPSSGEAPKKQEGK